MQETQADLVALGEASRILRVSPETTRRFANEGTLPSIRLSNGHRIFRRDDVERLALERRSR
jgi:excisionase family DNA binding protein